MAKKRDIKRIAKEMVDELLPYVSQLTNQDGSVIEDENAEYQNELAKQVALLVAKKIIRGYNELCNTALDQMADNEDFWPAYKGKNKLHRRIFDRYYEWKSIIELLKK